MSSAQDRDSLAQQRAMYGAPIGEIAASITSALGLTQGRLAEVLGLSAPMLSQLVSGHRVKIGNPAVVHRLQALLALADAAPGLSAEQVRDRLAAIRGEQATITAGSSTCGQPGGDARLAAVTVLRESAGAAELEAAAAATAAPDLAALLREAAAGAARG